MKPRLVGIEAARATLKDLCAAAARGEEVVITRRGRPIARVVGWCSDGPSIRIHNAVHEAGRTSIHVDVSGVEAAWPTMSDAQREGWQSVSVTVAEGGNAASLTAPTGGVVGVGERPVGRARVVGDGGRSREAPGWR